MPIMLNKITINVELKIKILLFFTKEAKIEVITDFSYPEL